MQKTEHQHQDQQEGDLKKKDGRTNKIHIIKPKLN